MHDFLEMRLKSHHLIGSWFTTPAEVVKHYGCIQAQDILQAKRVIWSRTENSTQEMIEQACRDWSIIRTRPMRGTLHYIAPEHVHWMLDVCAAKTLPWFTKRREFLGISSEYAERALVLIESSLKWGKVLTRTEIGEILLKWWVLIQTQRIYHLMCYAATRKLVCFGPPNGKEDTFVLLDEWVPNTHKKTIDEWYAELARMYVRSHGPCTTDDLGRWCGLGKWECKKAIWLIEKELESFEHEGKTYFYFPQKESSSRKKWNIRLLGWFDEYFLWYKDRSIVADTEHHRKLFTINGIFFPLVMLDGKIIGTRKRTFKKDTVYIDITIVDKSIHIDEKKIELQAKKYADFIWNKEVIVHIKKE